MPKVLIIDDEPQVSKTIEKWLTRLGHEVSSSLTLKDGLEKVFSEEFEVVFLDVNLPDGNGLEAIDDIKGHPNPPEIIIMTGLGDPAGAELAMQSRAWDYIQKSGSFTDLKLSLVRALKYRKQKSSKPLQSMIKRDGIIGESRQMKYCLKTVSKAVHNNSPVLISGETGTGKELFARAIHENSLRKRHAFTVVDCAALPEHLVESILFGHAKGAFTGADSDKIGLIKLSDKGTLFLDEVGELPLPTQKKLLRVLQEKKFRPVGSKEEISCDFRLVSASHRNIPQMIKDELFREDLYFRISSIKIVIPSLRNRKSDIPSLVEYHINNRKKLPGCPHDASLSFVEHLELYNWPGHVRELFNSIDYACSNPYQEATLFPKHLPENIRSFVIKNKFKNEQQFPDNHSTAKKTGNILEFKDHIDRTKSDYIQHLLSIAKGNIKKACRLSGLSKGHLYRLMKQYNLKK